MVIGTAFAAVVTALVKDIITPLIAAIGGQPNFETMTFTINHSKFSYGDFINALISFAVIAAVVYYLVVTPVGKLLDMVSRREAATERECPECLGKIPIAARKCMYCTTDLTPPTTTAVP